MESSCNQRRRSKLRRQRTVSIFFRFKTVNAFNLQGCAEAFLRLLLQSNLQSNQQIKVNGIFRNSSLKIEIMMTNCSIFLTIDVL